MKKITTRGLKRVVSMLVFIFAISLYLYSQDNLTNKLQLKGAPGMGLTAEPGGFIMQNIEPGKVVDIFDKTKIALTIYNRSDAYHTYEIKAGRPEDVGVEGWLKGYSPIPEGSWFRVEKDKIRIPPQSRAHIRMFIDIPKEDKYYNQKWVVGLSIRGLPEPGEKLALAVHPTYYIETLPKEDLKEKPFGKIGLVPGVKDLGDVSLGINKKIAKIKIYNNDNKKHTYKVYSFIPEKREGERITVSPGYSWIKDISWIVPISKKVTIKSNNFREDYIDLILPEDDTLRGKNWEGLLFVEDEEEKANFCRLRFRVK